MKRYLRGDLYYVDFGAGIGSEQQSIRPAVILQNNLGNYYSPTVILAPLTTKTTVKARLPVHCRLPPGAGLAQPSVVMLEQIRTVDKLRLMAFIGHLDEAAQRRIDWAAAVSLGFVADYNEQPLELCLCPACAKQFFDSKEYRISRANLLQTDKSTCDYCSVRTGYDFIIRRKPQKRPALDAGKIPK